jgi:hypothetical protein
MTRIECEMKQRDTFEIKLMDEQTILAIDIIAQSVESEIDYSAAEQIKWILINEVNKRLRALERGENRGWSATRRRLIAYLENKNGKPADYKELKRSFWWLTSKALRTSLKWACEVGAILKDEATNNFSLGPNAKPDKFLRPGHGQTLAELSIKRSMKNRDRVKQSISGNMTAAEITEICGMSLRTVQRHLSHLVRIGEVQSICKNYRTGYSIIDPYACLDEPQEELF